MYEDPNYNKADNEADYWRPFNKNLTNLSAKDKMKYGNYFLMQSDSFKMVSDFSSHHCKTWKYTQSYAGMIDDSPGFFSRFFTKFKLVLSYLF